MPQIQEDKASNARLIEIVHSIIKANSGKVTTKYLEREIGNKELIRYAITKLTLQGKIRRIKGFGMDKIEYFYHDISSVI